MIGIIDWLLFILVNGALLYGSFCLAGYLNGRNAPVAQLLVSGGIIYLAQATIIVLFLGVVLSTLNRGSVIITALALSALLIFFFRGQRQPLVRPLARGLRGLLRSGDIFLYLVLALFIFQAVVMLAKVAWLPPHVWDVFFYHLAPAVEWYQQGHIPLAIDAPARHMNQVPLGMTVLSYWFFIFFRHDFLVELPMFLWSLLLVPLSYAILRKSGVGPAWSLKFAILIFFIPIVLMQGITAKDHLGLNIAFLAGLFFLSNFLQQREPRQLILAGIAFGLMLGYKQAAPAYILVAGAFFLLLLWQNQRQVLMDKTQRLAFLKASAVSALAMLSIGGYWWVRKALLSGKLALVTLPPPMPVAGGGELGRSRFGLDSLFSNLAEFLPRVFDFRVPYGADLINISGFGPQFAAFGLLAFFFALVALFKKTERRQPFYLIMAVTVILFLLFTVSRYSGNANSYRILSFLPMAMIAYGAILLHRHGLLAVRANRLIINLLISGAIVWNIFFILPPAYTNPKLFREYVSMGEDYRTSGTYTQWFVIQRPNFYRLLAAMPSEEPVAIISPPLFNRLFRKGQAETWSYPYYDRRWRRHLNYFYEEGSLRCNAQRRCMPSEGLKQKLAKSNIHLVSSCPTNQCVSIVDPGFIELAPGFYYFRGGQ